MSRRVHAPALRRASPRWLGPAKGSLAAVAFFVIVSGCEDRRGGSVDVYADVAGEIVAVPPGRRQIVVAHEDIPGLMTAMTMSLDVEDPSVLEGVAPGDRIRFTLRRMDGRLAVQSLRRVAPEEGGPRRSPAAGTDLLGEEP